MMVSQLDSTCDDTNRDSTQLPAYDIHSVYFGENQSWNSYWYHGQELPGYEYPSERWSKGADLIGNSIREEDHNSPLHHGALHNT